MKTEKLRSALVNKDKVRGALRSFCDQNELPYFKVWRFAKGKTQKLEHDLGLRVSNLIQIEQCKAEKALQA